MSRPIHASRAPAVALAATLLAVVSLAHAAIAIEPRLVLEFSPGSAVVRTDQLEALGHMLAEARARSEPYHVAVRGYADTASRRGIARGAAANAALADARARALSNALRALGEGGCITRVALPGVPADAPPERVDAGGQHWLSRGLVVLEAPGAAYAPLAGAQINTDCP